MFTTEPSDTYMHRWLMDVADEGTFVMNAAAEWDIADYENVFDMVAMDWTIQTASA